MSASSRGWQTGSALLRRYPRVCTQCAQRRIAPPSWPRAYSASVAPEATISTPPQPPPIEPLGPQLTPPTSNSPYGIRSGIILTRAPLLTREPTPFESSFFLYQKRLNERLCSPFLKQLYFKTDTPPALDWNLKLRERNGVVAKDVGVYHARSVMGWNDEVLLESEVAHPGNVRKLLVADAEMRFSDDGEELSKKDRIQVEKPLPRHTEADRTNDVRRLDRALDKTLYLVVQKGHGSWWQFPTEDMPTDEALHQTAERILVQSVGVNINYWMVGTHPIAHFLRKPKYAESDPTELVLKGSKTFFMKGRILAGQVDLTGNTQGVTDFKWLTQEELAEALHPAYYSSIKGVFAER